MSLNQIIIGTRGSKLALIQANFVQSHLRKLRPDLEVEIKVFKTKGDKILDSPLSSIGDKGLFIRELEEALLSAEIDLAVHSLKDLPTELPAGLTLGGVLPREDARDVLVSKDGKKLFELEDGTVVATSSLRRVAQLKALNPKLTLIDIRGNIDTRIRKMENGYCDALILAGAGMLRAGYKARINDFLDPQIMIPAACQGIIGLEVREDDGSVKEIVDSLNHTLTFQVAQAERTFLKALEGGCQIPIGCYTSIQEGNMSMTGMVADLQGTEMIKKTLSAPLNSAVAMAERLAENIFQTGGREILLAIQRSSGHG